MARLVLTAENFAFGPVGKLLYVADLLKKKGHTLVFAGYGTSLQLAKQFPFAAIYEVDTDNPRFNSILESIIFQVDGVISSMDVASVIVAKRLKKPVVWIDCLFWFWDNIPEEVFDVDLYIRERSLNDEVNESRYGHKIKNLYSIGPIIGRVKRVKKKQQALISYGGGEASYWYKVGVDTHYPFVMTSILLDNIEWSQFDRTIVATNERITAGLAARFPQSPFEFLCLPQDRFLTELSLSEVILTTPGLVTAEIAFQTGTPAIFLPPSNNSQYLQLEEFRENGLAPASVHLSDFMPRLNLSVMPLRRSTQEVLKQLRALEQSNEIQTCIGTRIHELVYDRRLWSAEFITNGRRFIASLGGNSVQAVADKITELLSTRTSG